MVIPSEHQRKVHLGPVMPRTLLLRDLSQGRRMGRNGEEAHQRSESIPESVGSLLLHSPMGLQLWSEGQMPQASC
jgi:hypothetical protein